MDATNRMENKRRIPRRLRGILSLSIIVLIIAPNIPAHAEGNVNYKNLEWPWKIYPYRPPGTEIFFPNDEGSHNTYQFPVEWWYANFHLTGQITGKEYGSFVAFYHIQSTILERQEVRIFSISDVAAEKTYTNAQIGTLTASNDHLDLSFKHISNDCENDNQNVNTILNENLISDNQELNMKIENAETTMKSTNQGTMKSTTQSSNIEKINTIFNVTGDNENSTHDLLQCDYWYTKANDQGLLPFQYTLVVGGKAQQDSTPIELAVDMDCLKQPLIVGADGFLDFGEYGFSYYYSLTKLAVTGTIILHGITEEVIGSAWIDHQWGNLINQNPPPFGLTMTYEWFSIQLNDNQEIMVGDAWDRETGEKIGSYTGGLNLVNCDESSELLKDYTIIPQAFWNDSVDNCFFSAQWHIAEISKSIDLTITPIYLNQVIRAKEECPLFQQFLEKLLPSACFWEGVCTVSGTINSISMNGKAYVELTHSFDNRDKIDLTPFLNGDWV
jgi:predicted secreted hydrolase